MSEAQARCAAVHDGCEHRAEEHRKAVRVPMFSSGCATSSAGSRLIVSWSSPSRRSPPHRRFRAARQPGAHRRGRSPVEQANEWTYGARGVVVLRFAEQDALRPSRSRRFTSLPSVAPRIVRRDRSEHDFRFRVVPRRIRRTPIQSPHPTDDSVGALVKSRHRDQSPPQVLRPRPSAISAAFRRCAAGDPGFTRGCPRLLARAGLRARPRLGPYCLERALRSPARWPIPRM